MGDVFWRDLRATTTGQPMAGLKWGRDDRCLSGFFWLFHPQLWFWGASPQFVPWPLPVTTRYGPWFPLQPIFLDHLQSVHSWMAQSPLLQILRLPEWQPTEVSGWYHHLKCMRPRPHLQRPSFHKSGRNSEMSILTHSSGDPDRVTSHFEESQSADTVLPFLSSPPVFPLSSPFHIHSRNRGSSRI